MSSSPTSDRAESTPASSRRDRLRQETTAEIKTRAWAEMARVGAEALSLREVARQMGMAPSALYRYFAARNDLLTALIVDAFDSLAAALDAEYHRQADAASAMERFVSVCHAYRAWAHANRTEWGLIFSSAIPDYNGTAETKAASLRASDVLVRCMQSAFAAGEIDVERLDAEVDPSMRRPLDEWSEFGGYGLPAAALAAALWCYAALHGAIALEINEHLPPSLLGNDALFDTSIRATIAHLGHTG